MLNNFLVDTNFLISLVLSTHPHNRISRDFYLNSHENEFFYICRSVQISFLRLLTQKIDPNFKPLTNVEATLEFEKLMKANNVLFISEIQKELDDWTKFAKHKSPAPYLWMDAYLAFFAYKNNFTLLTFDKGFLQWKSQGLNTKILT